MFCICIRVLLLLRNIRNACKDLLDINWRIVIYSKLYIFVYGYFFQNEYYTCLQVCSIHTWYQPLYSKHGQNKVVRGNIYFWYFVMILLYIDDNITLLPLFPDVMARQNRVNSYKNRRILVVLRSSLNIHCAVSKE